MTYDTGNPDLGFRLAQNVTVLNWSMESPPPLPPLDNLNLHYLFLVKGEVAID
jgi:hypothetical protein